MDTEKSTSPARVIIAAFITLLSTGLGLVGGFLAEILYEHEGPPKVGWIAGVVTGLIVGIIYCVFSIRQIPKSLIRRQFIGRGTLAGLAAGTISAATAHFALMAAYGLNLHALGIGLLCGIPAGAILGLIASALFVTTIKTTIPESSNDQ